MLWRVNSTLEQRAEGGGPGIAFSLYPTTIEQLLAVADAGKIMVSLKTIKPPEFFLRQGLTIYEFVGANDVIPDIRAGRAHLQARRGS